METWRDQLAEIRATYTPYANPLSYLAWLLFLLSLLMPAYYDPPMLVEGSGGNVSGFVILLLAPLFGVIGILEFDRSSLFGLQLMIHSLGNLILLFSPLIRLNNSKVRGIILICTILGLSLMFDLHQDIDFGDLRPGYFLWLAAHITLLMASFIKSASGQPKGKI